MIGVCVVYTRDAFSHNQYDYILSSFKPDRIFLIDGEEVEVSNIIGKAERVETAADLPDVPLVVFSPENGRYLPGTESLVGFEHPVDCIYLFGPDNRYLNEDHLGGRNPDHIVYIPVDTHDDLYSWQACAIAMWDRRLKCG